jgi:catechol 2,3-dioxygenase-like lactoylglutathione lyase family enzyme
MERVIGIGGVFFKARDPEKLGAWYREHLGIAVENNMMDFVRDDKLPPELTRRTVWALFPANTDYFGPPPSPFMINYRVASMERMLAQLRSHGVTIEKSEDFDYGRFAWITDPEGTKVELWEPIEEAKPKN